MAFDVAAFRTEFPSLDSGIAHFDNPGGTQTPRVVGEAIARTLTGPLSQRGAATVSQRNAEEAVAGFRSAIADLVGGVPGGVVHGRSATALTYDFSRTLSRRPGRAGDEIVRRASWTTTPTCARGSRRPSAPVPPCGGCGSTRRPASSTCPRSTRSPSARGWSR